MHGVHGHARCRSRSLAAASLLLAFTSIKSNTPIIERRSVPKVLFTFQKFYKFFLRFFVISNFATHVCSIKYR
jgi:hypothetical protein